MRRLSVSMLALFAAPGIALAQDAPRPTAVPVTKDQRSAPASLPLKFIGGPTSSAITPGDLMTRVYKFADDSMMGRLAGTLWNDKGTDYIASELQRLGIKPAGENGGYFQNALVRSELSSAASLSVGGRSFEVWKDYAPRDQGTGTKPFDGAQAIFGGTFGDTASYISDAQAAGKVVVIKLPAAADGRRNFNVNRGQLSARFPSASAIAVAQIDYTPPGYVNQAYRQAGVRPRPNATDVVNPAPSYIYITNEIGRAMLGVHPDSATRGQPGMTVNGSVLFDTRLAPGRNVIGIIPGSDPKLRGQYIAIGAHNDHIGFSNRPVDHDSIKVLMRTAAPQGADSPAPTPSAEQWLQINREIAALRATRPARTDSIFNGADDDASGSMTVLEIAEAMATARQKPRRSVIFVWHVAEELGLFGAKYFNDNPTVPRDSIVAQLNIDMVGRGGSNDITGETKEHALINGGPGYLQLIGSRRLSTELGDMIETVNSERKLGMKFDYSLDANGHPQNIYCRSDHYEYARHGIPVVFLTTGGHADYHQVTDEPQYIDYSHMSKIATFVQQSAIRLANLDHRVVVDKPRPDPRGVCQQ